MALNVGWFYNVIITFKCAPFCILFYKHWSCPLRVMILFQIIVMAVTWFYLNKILRILINFSVLAVSLLINVVRWAFVFITLSFVSTEHSLFGLKMIQVSSYIKELKGSFLNLPSPWALHFRPLGLTSPRYCSMLWVQLSPSPWFLKCHGLRELIFGKGSNEPSLHTQCK